jgi:ATP-dependent DNA helicase RecG
MEKLMNSDNCELHQLLSKGENLELEFKSDLKSLPDRDLVAAVVSLANTEGGDLLIGVEDDGTITGLHPNHKNTTGLISLIANKTNPSLSVDVDLFEVEGLHVVRVHVPKSRQLVSTSEGLIQRRRTMANGKPEAVPFYPHEFVQRQSSLSIIDPSAIPILSLSEKDLNPLERHRIREAIRRYGGDTSLLPLEEDELDSALGFVTNIDGVRRPTLAGILFLGREDALRQHVPAHETAFQVLEGTDVRVNEFFRKPLLQTFEEIEKLFSARVVEKEIQVGLFRVPVPNFERRAFREAFVNALVHRDYSRLGAVHVRLDDDGMTISSPGGFVEGVNLQNLLVTEPRPRNPLLADIAKRIGLAERTGRGIDRIFEGVLRYGRATPDFSRSDSTSVILQLSNAEADMDFLEMILRQEQLIGRNIPLTSLIILSRLRQERRLTTTELSSSIQKAEHETRSIIEKLVESGLVEAHGTKRRRSYTLSAKVYRKSGEKAAYVRQAGFDTIQQEQMVLSYIKKHGSIKRADVMELCMLTKDQAYNLLRRLKENESIILKGHAKGTFYILKE